MLRIIIDVLLAAGVFFALAGSIGIIGIALIMSLSNGIQNYIDKVQEDTLSSYPITIQAESVDMTGLMTSLMGDVRFSDVAVLVLRVEVHICTATGRRSILSVPRSWAGFRALRTAFRRRARAC